MTSRRNPQAVAERRAERAQRAEFKKLLRAVRRKLRAEHRYAGLTTDGEVLVTSGLLVEFVFHLIHRTWSLWIESRRENPRHCADHFEAPTAVWLSPPTIAWLVDQIKSRDPEAEHSAENRKSIP